MFMHAADVKITHVPYRGAAPAVTDLIAGQIDGVVDNPPTVISHIQAGTLRPLAVAAKARMALLPEVPTAAEAGVANYEASSWFGIAAPAGTPPAIVDRLHKAIAAAVRTPGDAGAFQQVRRAPGRRYAGGVRGSDPRRAHEVGRDHQGGEHQGGVTRLAYRGRCPLPPARWRGSPAHGRRPQAHSESVWLIMRWRSTRLFPRNASATI